MTATTKKRKPSAPATDRRPTLALLAVEDLAMLIACRACIWPPVDSWEDVESYWRGEGSRDKAAHRTAAKKWIAILETRPENRHA